jgi:hypothetical protein
VVGGFRNVVSEREGKGQERERKGEKTYKSGTKHNSNHVLAFAD